MRAQHTCAATTARAPCVNILPFTVKYHKSAVLVYRLDIQALFPEHKLIKKLSAYAAKVTCKNRIVIRRLSARISEKVSYGFLGGRGKCQEKTINFFKTSKPLILLGFRHFIYGCGYGVVAMKIRL